MPKLGDFIGALLSDVAQARVQADLEALKIAETYSGHELLKLLPVPRFRLPTVTVDAPVIVMDVGAVAATGGRPSAAPRFFEKPSGAELEQAVGRAISKSGLAVSRGQRKQAVGAADARVRSLFAKGPEALLNTKKIVDEVAETVLRSLSKTARVTTKGKGKVKGSDDVSKLTEPLKDAIRRLLLTKILEAPHLQVRVTASEIKAHADNESLLRVHLSLAEDAYEIVTDEAPGSSYRIVPE